jgi:hypothetical protein
MSYSRTAAVWSKTQGVRHVVEATAKATLRVGVEAGSTR